MDNGEWRMENGERRMKNGEWRMGNGEWRMENQAGACSETEKLYQRIILLSRQKHAPSR